MRHATRSQRLSRPTGQRDALLAGLVRSLVLHGQIRTTRARAKEAQRLADRLVSLGKEGSVHSRRQAFRILRDRTLVKKLFAEIAPRCADLPGGYTRVARLSLRRGDGAQQALLAFSRLPARESAPPARAPTPPQPPPAQPTPPKRQPPRIEEAKKPKGLFEGLRHLWTRQKKGGARS